jgi:hypothetical protein
MNDCNHTGRTFFPNAKMRIDSFYIDGFTFYNFIQRRSLKKPAPKLQELQSFIGCPRTLARKLIGTIHLSVVLILLINVCRILIHVMTRSRKMGGFLLLKA